MSIELHNEADEFIRLTLCFELREQQGRGRETGNVWRMSCAYHYGWRELPPCS